MRPLQPIVTVHLFAPLESKLLELLKSLSSDEWRAMALPRWSVKDIAAHLLDTALRRLSMCRDGFVGESFTGASYQDLVAFLNGLNADWVRAFQRISPTVLIALLEQASGTMIEYLNSLDPNGKSNLSVAWAGEERSANWFDIAREYTERWHHQQQIRDAVGRQAILTKELYAPVLETFVRVLPHTYREVLAPPGTTIEIAITGTSGGTWYLHRNNKWELGHDQPGSPAAKVEIPDNIAWRLFTKGLDRRTFESHVRRAGDRRLTDPIASALAVMA